MANYWMLQQEADDYTKAMGSYVAAVEDYNAEAKAFNELPYVKRANRVAVEPTTYVRDGTYTLSDGQVVVTDKLPKWGDGSALKPGDRVTVSSREITEPADPEVLGAKPSVRTEYVATKAPVPTFSATEPRELTFTRAEAAALQNPPQSLASAAAQTPSAIERLKEATGAKWSPYQGGLDSNKGILARVLSGKV